MADKKKTTDDLLAEVKKKLYKDGVLTPDDVIKPVQEPPKAAPEATEVKPDAVAVAVAEPDEQPWIYPGERRPVVVMARTKDEAQQRVSGSPEYDGCGAYVYTIADYAKMCKGEQVVIPKEPLKPVPRTSNPWIAKDRGKISEAYFVINCHSGTVSVYRFTDKNTAFGAAKEHAGNHYPGEPGPSFVKIFHASARWGDMDAQLSFAKDIAIAAPIGPPANFIPADPPVDAAEPGPIAIGGGPYQIAVGDLPPGAVPPPWEPGVQVEVGPAPEEEVPGGEEEEDEEAPQ